MVKGVRYLHSCNIAHGDIKGVNFITLAKGPITNSAYPQPNVLISDSNPPMAVLGDLGFTRVATLSVKITSEDQGTKSFMSPELLVPAKFGLEKGVPSKEADIYALGMTVYQVLTGNWPFFPKRETEIMHAVMAGERPPKPENAEEIGLTEAMWDLLEDSWRQDWKERPKISTILGTFCNITGERKTTDSAMGIAEPQLDDDGRQNSVDSQSSLLTPWSCESNLMRTCLKH